MAATIKDVARLAGCSIKTVSRVINNEPYVTEETRARVNSAIRELNFAPNISARRLVQQRSFVIGILLLAGGYGQSELLSRLMETGYEYHYDFLVQTYFPTSTTSKEKLARLVRERRVDGLVTTPPCDMDDYIAGLVVQSGIPLVRINPYDRLIDLPYVAEDDFQGARSLTAHLIGLGHRRIAFFKGPRNHRMSADRYLGYKAALEEHGLPVRPELVKNSEFNFDGGYTAARLVIEEDPAPTAIFAGSDEAALGAIFAMQEAGRRMPEDISIAGFDDLAHAKEVWPGLTSVSVPYNVIVERATLMLIDLLNGKTVDQPQVVYPTRLVVRGSTAAVET
ncbi:MAG TPA: LacI family DNA-binding transcriptional regulator [Anaerolineaceae bacterium]|nr:LacI family DNA-binding transcriptional regulator [Anaerolineaceae bacterium]